MIQTNMLKTNTVEKSFSSESFFCIKALPSPLSTNTCKIVVKTRIREIVPKTEGSNNLANNIETQKVSICADPLSRKRHKKLLKILLTFIVYNVSANLNVSCKSL